MMIIKIMIVLMALVISVFAEEGAKFFKPSFSCDNVKAGSIEYKICTDEGLTKLDKQLSGYYSDAKNIDDTVKQTQREWMKERNKCEDNKCIVQAYQLRIKEFQDFFNNTTGDKEVCEEISSQFDKITSYKQSNLYYLNQEKIGKYESGIKYRQKCPNWFEEDRDMYNEYANIRFTNLEINGTMKTLMWTDPLENMATGKLAMVDDETCTYKVLARRLSTSNRIVPPWEDCEIARIGKRYYIKRVRNAIVSDVIYFVELDFTKEIVDFDHSKKRCEFRWPKNRRR